MFGAVVVLAAGAYTHPWRWVPAANLAEIVLGWLAIVGGRRSIAAAKRHHQVMEANRRKLRQLIKQEWRNN